MAGVYAELQSFVEAHVRGALKIMTVGTAAIR